MAKKVIFVGGTAFSGSTFFHMALANDVKGFACGEVRWIFYPHRPDHVEQMNQAPKETSAIWRTLREKGAKNLYQSLFDLFPQVEFIVDSSKNPIWIQSQMTQLRKQGIEAKNILIWKTPLEFANSTKKRGRLQNWDKEWLNYHRLYTSLIPEWKGVKYRDFASNDAFLEQICTYLGIPYFDGKLNYWEKQHHSFGGNYTARFHLHEKKTAQKEYLDKTFDSGRLDGYRKISYSQVDDQELENRIQHRLKSMPEFDSILALLESKDVGHSSEKMEGETAVKFSPHMLQLRKLHYYLRSYRGKLRYDRFVKI